jgi:hypothetical protein
MQSAVSRRGDAVRGQRGEGLAHRRSVRQAVAGEACTHHERTVPLQDEHPSGAAVEVEVTGLGREASSPGSHLVT